MSSRGPLGRAALVVGAARSGVALALHLTAEGQKVRVVDRKPAADLQSTISQMPSGVDPGTRAQTRELLSVPSSAISNAVR